MKKIYYFLLLPAFLLLSSPTFGQVFEGKGDLSVNAGLSLGVIGYGYGTFGSAGFPIPLSANLEYGIHEMISVGPYLGYLRRSYGPAGDRYRFTSFAFGAQGVFHASPFLNEHLDMDINEEKVDLYGKIILGYETYSWSYNGQDWNEDYMGDTGRGVFGPVLGVRYMFSPNFGGYAEGGRGAFGWLTFGLSIKM